MSYNAVVVSYLSNIKEDVSWQIDAFLSFLMPANNSLLRPRGLRPRTVWWPRITAGLEIQLHLRISTWPRIPNGPRSPMSLIMSGPRIIRKGLKMTTVNVASGYQGINQHLECCFIWNLKSNPIVGQNTNPSTYIRISCATVIDRKLDTKTAAFLKWSQIVLKPTVWAADKGR